jgi:RNA polymerase sigma factor (sigma-70 family)
MSTIYVIDDDRGVRESLVLLLSLQGHATRAFDSGEAFLAAALPEWSGCALVDLRMPGMSGLELQRELAARGISLPLIFITAHGDVTATRQALKSGAVDFIEKPLDEVELLAAIESACKRDEHARQSRAHSERFSELLTRLTPREREILDRVVAGEHNREIAQALGISARTVEVHKAHLMDKLQIERIPDLVRAMLGLRRDGPPG